MVPVSMGKLHAAQRSLVDVLRNAGLGLYADRVEEARHVDELITNRAELLEVLHAITMVTSRGHVFHGVSEIVGAVQRAVAELGRAITRELEMGREDRERSARQAMVTLPPPVEAAVSEDRAVWDHERSAAR